MRNFVNVRDSMRRESPPPIPPNVPPELRAYLESLHRYIDRLVDKLDGGLIPHVPDTSLHMTLYHDPNDGLIGWIQV